MNKTFFFLVFLSIKCIQSMEQTDNIYTIGDLIKMKIVTVKKECDDWTKIKPTEAEGLTGIKITFNLNGDLPAESMTKLSLISCGLNRPPIVRLPQITCFWCVGNKKLENCPVFISTPELKELVLWDNNLRFGPIDSQLPAIETLDVCRNKLEEFSFTSETLVFLNLLGNQLTRLGECELPNVRILMLSHNRFKRPPDVASFKNLTSLGLSHNELSCAPDVRNLLQLTKLFLGHNYIREFPHVPASLIELEVQENQLTHVPDDLVYPEQLWLNVKENYLSEEDVKRLLALGLKSVKCNGQKA